MKKIFTLILVFIMSIMSFVVPISANSYDSNYLTSEEREILSARFPEQYSMNPEYFVKVYPIHFFYFFKERIDIINDYAKQEHSLKNYLIPIVSSRPEDSHLAEIRDGKPVMGPNERWWGFCKYTVHPDLVLEPSVNVKDVYCFDDLYLGFGACIYYKTDHGDYILYYSQVLEKIYLFPLEYFCEFSKLYIDGVCTVEEEIDMSFYLVKHEPHAVFHPDDDGDEKCDICENEISEDSMPFPDISHIASKNTERKTDKKTDKPTDTNTENVIDTETEEKIDGCGSSIALSAISIIGVVGSLLVIKKRRKHI